MLFLQITQVSNSSSVHQRYVPYLPQELINMSWWCNIISVVTFWICCIRESCAHRWIQKYYASHLKIKHDINRQNSNIRWFLIVASFYKWWTDILQIRYFSTKACTFVQEDGFNWNVGDFECQLQAEVLKFRGPAKQH